MTVLTTGPRTPVPREADPAPGPRLWLWLIGDFAVTGPGRRWTATSLGSRKARTLLALLAAEGGRMVPTDRIVEVLWGQDQPRRPVQNIATLVSRLRAMLGADTIAGRGTGYRLGGSVAVDLWEADRLITAADAELAGARPTLSLVTAQRALDLLDGGEVLQAEPDADWTERARRQHELLLRRARHAVAGAALRSGDMARACAAAEAALASDPVDEAAYRILMRAYHATGEPARACVAYDRLRATLVAELGVDPAPATRELYASILQNRLAPPAKVPGRGRDASSEPAPSKAPAPAGRCEPGPVRRDGAELLVGREDAARRLAHAWAQALSGQPRLLLVDGEAGIGRTRLADEAVRLARTSSAIALTVRCYPTERSLFLQPIVEAVSRLVTSLPADVVREAAAAQTPAQAGALAALVPELAAVAPELATAAGTGPPAWVDHEAHRRQVYDAVRAFLAHVSACLPVVLVLDDLHHADAASVEFLHYLQRLTAAPAHLLTIATARSEEGDAVLAKLAPVAHRITIGPLPKDAVLRLADAWGCAELGELVARRTGGHTLCVVETIRALAAGRSGIPPALRTAVLARVRRLGTPAEELLGAAAVLGGPFTPAAIAGALGIGLPEAVRRCEQLLRYRLVMVAGRHYELANDVLRDVLRESMPAPTRQAIADRFVHIGP